MSTNDTATGGMSLTVLIIVQDQNRSRSFYHHVMGAEIIRTASGDRAPDPGLHGHNASLA